MYKILVVSCLIFTGNVFAAGPEATFEAVKLSYWWSGASDVVLGRVKDVCTPQEEAYIKEQATADAVAQCNSSARGYRCFGATAVITWNGPLDDNMMAKYGLTHNPYTLNTPRGCEAKATAFGF